MRKRLPCFSLSGAVSTGIPMLRVLVALRRTVALAYLRCRTCLFAALPLEAVQL